MQSSAPSTPRSGHSKALSHSTPQTNLCNTTTFSIDGATKQPSFSPGQKIFVILCGRSILRSPLCSSSCSYFPEICGGHFTSPGRLPSSRADDLLFFIRASSVIPAWLSGIAAPSRQTQSFSLKLAALTPSSPLVTRPLYLQQHRARAPRPHYAAPDPNRP